MLRALAIIFGLLFLAVGIVGFIPSFLKDDMLFNVFHLNKVHSIFKIIAGVIALWVGFTSNPASRAYFEVFGIFFGIEAILGFIYVDRDIFGLIANNTADTWLHLVIAIIFLYLGFAFPNRVR